METLWNTVRNRFSADKTRYLKGNYNLDLTYITDRLIAMAFPADGMESRFRNKIDDVAQLLKENHGDHFMIYNLSERTYDYSKFNFQVLHWCGFPDHHAPPLKKLFEIVKSIYSWLLSDKENVAIIHCLAGKGRTGTVIAAFLLFSGLFQNSDKALAFFATKRSLNNWGVTNPSQVRYVRYMEDIIYKHQIPLSRPLKLVYLHMKNVPAYSSSFVDSYPLIGKAGCCLLLNVYCVSNGKQLVFSNENLSEEKRTFPSGFPVTFDINCIIQEDQLIEIYYVTPLYRMVLMLRLEFHVGMIQKSVLRFSKNDIDLASQDKRFSNDFFLDLGFQIPVYSRSISLPLFNQSRETANSLKTSTNFVSPMSEAAVLCPSELRASKISEQIEIPSQVRSSCPATSTTSKTASDWDVDFEAVENEEYSETEDQKSAHKWWEGAPSNSNGEINYFNESSLAEAKQQMTLPKYIALEKGGWLTKQGHNVKNWKRRWFVLKDPTLSYYIKPRDITPAGVIILDDILTIVSKDNVCQYTNGKRSERQTISKDNLNALKPASWWFEICTKKTNYLICADTEQEMKEWVESIEFVVNQREMHSTTISFNGIQFTEKSFERNAESLKNIPNRINQSEGTVPTDYPLIDMSPTKQDAKSSFSNRLENGNFDIQSLTIGDRSSLPSISSPKFDTVKNRVKSLRLVPILEESHHEKSSSLPSTSNPTDSLKKLRNSDEFVFIQRDPLSTNE